MKGSKRVGLAAACVGAVALMGGVATAATPPADAGVPTALVRYSDKMLSTEAGVHELYRRLNRAAEQVCPEIGGSRFTSSETLQCRRAAVARAVAKIDNPQLAALQASRTKSG